MTEDFIGTYRRLTKPLGLFVTQMDGSFCQMKILTPAVFSGGLNLNRQGVYKFAGNFREVINGN